MTISNTPEINKKDIQNKETHPEVISFLKQLDENNSTIINTLNETDLGFKDFKKILYKINSIIIEKKGRKTDKNKEKRGTAAIYYKDDSNAYNLIYIPPEDKEKYLEKMFEIFIDENIDSETKAKIMYYAIQYIHPFIDGNGRTGRLLYKLIKTNYNLKDTTLHDLLGNTSGRNFLDIPDAEDISHIIEYHIISEQLKKKKKNIKVWCPGLMEKELVINPKLISPKKEKAQKILDARILVSYNNLQNFILYKVNKKRKYTDFLETKDKDSIIIKFDGEAVLESLNENDLETILDEYKKFEAKRMKIVLSPSEINKIIENNPI